MKYKSVQELADKIEYSRWAVYKLIDSGHVKAVQIGGFKYIEDKEFKRVLTFVKKRKKQGYDRAFFPEKHSKKRKS